MLRQQLEPDTRVHGLILGNEDWNPNVIPNYAKVGRPRLEGHSKGQIR